MLEGCAFVNGSPQNTFVPGLVELAENHGVFLAGDDFKSGQVTNYLNSNFNCNPNPNRILIPRGKVN